MPPPEPPHPARTSTTPAERPAGPVWSTVLTLLRVLPAGLLSRFAGALADLPLPRPLRRPVLSLFARATGIDVNEAEKPLEVYPTVNAFFVRRLRPGARSFPDDPRVVASPVDGVVGRVGTIEAGRAVQAKGHAYEVAELLGDPALAREFDGGTFLTVYLAPRHYHRIHTPLPGGVVLARHIPGQLFPVNRAAVARVPRLFAVNERLLAVIETAIGSVALVAVGAFNVGRISAAFDPAWSGREGGWITNRGDAPPPERRYDPPRPLEAGAEIMAFHLGSTVIVLAPEGVRPVPTATPGREVRSGEILASVPKDH